MAEKNIIQKTLDDLADLATSIQELSCMDPAVDHKKNLKPSKRRILERSEGKSASKRGIYNDELIEAEPDRIVAKAEKQIKKGNAWIVIGRDRPAGVRTGYGGAGHHRAAAIDLCVGPQGRDIKEWDNRKRETLSINPDLLKDSARIYISSKTDVDHNFGLADGSLGNVIGKSAIALKADGVRIIGREGVKIITKGPDVKNSRGCKMMSVAGIDLIAGNDDTDLQPLVKGADLTAGLKQLADLVNSLNGIMVGFMNSQMKFNQSVMKHYHYSPFFGQPTTPGLDTVMSEGINVSLDQVGTSLADAALNKINLVNWKINYCEPAGSMYINSRLNNTN